MQQEKRFYNGEINDYRPVHHDVELRYDARHQSIHG